MSVMAPAPWPRGPVEIGRSRQASSRDAVETAIAREFLTRSDRRFVLELGVGDGRLSSVIGGDAGRYVGIDVDRAALSKSRNRLAASKAPNLIQANAGRLPIADNSVSLAVLVRLLHWFPEPAPLLAEVRRVLIPGGHLLLSTDPRPTFATLAFDLWTHLRGTPDEASVTFSATPRVTIRVTVHPGHVATRPLLDRMLREGGFTTVARRGSGLESFPVFRLIPPKVFVRLAPMLGGLPWIPRDFLLLRVTKG